MAQAMKRIAARDLSAEIVGVGRRGEIGQMADALKVFRRTAVEFRAVHGELAERHGLRELSMGTSQDFAVAAEEGATIIRLGSLLYGHGAP